MTAAFRACLELPADASMTSIRQLAGDVKDLVSAEGAGDLALDCAHVAACDLTLVQLLASARATLAKQGRGLALLNVPKSLEAALSRAGMDMFQPEPGLSPGAH